MSATALGAAMVVLVSAGADSGSERGREASTVPPEDPAPMINGTPQTVSGDPPDAHAAVPARYFATVTTQHVGVRIGVNDVALGSDPDGKGMNADLPLNPWLQPEGNVLTVDLRWPAGLAFEPGQAMVRASVFLADPESSSPKPKEVLAVFVWPQEGVNEAYPHRARVPLRIGQRVPSMLWEQADRLTEVTNDDRRAILALVEEFRESLAGGDAEEAARHLEYKTADLARAEYHDAAEMRDVVVSQLQWLMKGENLSMAPLTEEQLVTELVGLGRAVHVRRRNGEPALTVSSGSRHFGFSIYVSRIGGRWTIVR